MPAIYMEAKFPFQVLLLWQLCGIGAPISLFLTDLGFFSPSFDCQNLYKITPDSYQMIRTGKNIRTYQHF